MGAEQLRTLEPGQLIVYGGDRITRVPPELAAAFRPATGSSSCSRPATCCTSLGRRWNAVDAAVEAARRAFLELGTVDDDAISAFFGDFAGRLADDTMFAPIAEANAADVADARRRGRSTTRLELSSRMRARHGRRPRTAGGDAARRPGRRRGDGRAPRAGGSSSAGRRSASSASCSRAARTCSPTPPGVLRSGNTVVFRIGSDALGTARAIVEHALASALAESGLPPVRSALLDSLAVAGDGLGAVLASCSSRSRWRAARAGGRAARRRGPASRHPGEPARHRRRMAGRRTGRRPRRASRAAVLHSLDRKVCNTLNVCCIARGRGRRTSCPRSWRRGAAAARSGELADEAARPSSAARRTSRASASSGWSTCGGRGRRPRAAGRTGGPGPSWPGVGVGGQPGDHAGRGRRVGRGDRAVQPPQPPAGGDVARRRIRPSRSGSGPASTPPSSVTGSPAGSTVSSRSTGPSSACPTGSTAACSPAARSCRETPCSRCGPAPSSTTPTCTGERACRSEPAG